MEIKYNVTGEDRKRLVKTVADYYGVKAKYMGMPSMAYKLVMPDAVGERFIDKDGTLILPESDRPGGLIDALEEAGFKAADAPDVRSEKPRRINPYEGGKAVDTLEITLPMTDGEYENLRKLTTQKRTLLERATGFAGLQKDGENTTIIFEGEADTDEARAYSNLAAKMAFMAKTQSRISEKEKPITNEKYEFRCFLLRLGFIGDEWKADRKTLLKNLSGSAAFKNTRQIAKATENA